jgi:mevalonate kinase
MSIGFGFGKIILIGDQFINYGVPAVVSAIDLKTKAIVEKVRTGDRMWVVKDKRKETPGYKKSKLRQQEESIRRILEAMKVSPERFSLKIVFEGDLVAASGLGASAASCVSLVRALNAEFQLGLKDVEVNEIAYEGEKAYHGNPSGIDNTASTFGGIFLFRKDISAGTDLIERIGLRKNLELVVADSGVVVNTAAVGDYIKAQMKKCRGKFESAREAIVNMVSECRRNLESFNLAMVGRLMTEYHNVAIRLGLSHKKLIHLCNVAIENGAMGAKLTGGGMGGNMIALTPGIELQETVAFALEKKGYQVLRVTIGGNA